MTSAPTYERAVGSTMMVRTSFSYLTRSPSVAIAIPMTVTNEVKTTSHSRLLRIAIRVSERVNACT